RGVAVYGRVEGDGGWSEQEWTRHASGLLTPADTARPETSAPPEWPPADATPADTEGMYAALDTMGLRYGPLFQGVHAVWLRGDEVFAEVSLAEQEQTQATRFGLHPALLDAALQSMAIRVLAGENGSETPAGLPFSWSGVTLLASGATMLRVH